MSRTFREFSRSDIRAKLRNRSRFPFVAVFVLATSVVGLIACQEAREDEVVTLPPSQPNVPPFPVSAPLLSLLDHADGWQRVDCTRCHTTRLIVGHAGFPETECVRCHGYNGTKEPGCRDCHGVSSVQGYPDSGVHEFHVAEKGLSCAECHDQNIHRNGGLDIALRRAGEFVRAGGPPVGDVKGPGCTDVGCHESRPWKPDACDTCHSSPPQNPLHERHLAERDAESGEALTCRDCHLGNQHDADIASGTIEVGGREWIGYDRFTGSCTTTCHESRAQQWSCDACHGNPPETGAHVVHAKQFQIGCDVCHSSHEHTYHAAMTPFEADKTVRVAFLFQRGEWDSAARTCRDVGCHVDREWK